MITLLPFKPSDQAEARLLILSGLVEHWGFLDAAKNPDLENIALSYAEGFFLVTRQDGQLVGTGALLPTSDPATWQIVRMSVARDLRRSGLGRQILSRLEQEARQRGARRLILETTATWQGVISFYLGCGYQILRDPEDAQMPEDVYFEKWL